jgi:hypothetical protein
LLLSSNKNQPDLLHFVNGCTIATIQCYNHFKKSLIYIVAYNMIVSCYDFTIILSIFQIHVVCIFQNHVSETTMCEMHFVLLTNSYNSSVVIIVLSCIDESGSSFREINTRGGSRREGAHPRRAPLKLEKIWFFGVKSWFFTRNTPNIFAPTSARRNFFKCPPTLPTWNPGSRPWILFVDINVHLGW